MRRHIYLLKLVFEQVDRHRLRFILAILALILFVLGAGAPGDSGSYKDDITYCCQEQLHNMVDLDTINEHQSTFP